MKKWKVIGRRWGEEPKYYDWDEECKYPTYEAIEDNEWSIEAEDLQEAEAWLLNNHPEWYLGANIIEENGGDFCMIAVPSYYEGIYNTTDRKAIIELIKEGKGKGEDGVLSNDDIELW